jgi:hypothetical protein
VTVTAERAHDVARLQVDPADLPAVAPPTRFFYGGVRELVLNAANQARAELCRFDGVRAGWSWQ